MCAFVNADGRWNLGGCMHLCCVYLCCQTVLKLYQPLHVLTISSAIRHNLTYKTIVKLQLFIHFASVTQGHWEDWAQNRWTGQYHKLKSECRPETNNDFRWLRLIQPCSQLRQLHGPVALNRFYSIHPCEEFILGSSPTVYKSMKQKEQHKKALLKIKWCSGFRQSMLCLNPLEF